MTERTFDESTPRKTFVGSICAGEVDYSVSVVIVEAVVEMVREKTAEERARRRWKMPAQEEPNLSACSKLKSLE